MHFFVKFIFILNKIYPIKQYLVRQWITASEYNYKLSICPSNDTFFFMHISPVLPPIASNP